MTINAKSTTILFMSKDKRTGIAKHKDKPLRNSQPNQWQGNPKQLLFMRYYLDVNEPQTFANIYKSAVKAGYSDSYARDLSSTKAIKWLDEYTNTSNLELEHLEQQLAELIIDKNSVDSKSIDDTRLKAIELVAKLKGYMIERKQVQSVVKVELGKVNAPIEQID